MWSESQLKKKNSVSEKRKPWNECKQENTRKEKYLEAKKKLGGFFHLANCKAEKKRFGNVMQENDQKCCMFKIGKRMVKTW